jgi:histidinol-phosphate/aromatic aminotransferase/cobyric acid decarboxylase-like protein
MTRAIVVLLIAAALAVAGWAIHGFGLAAGRAEIQTQWDQQRIADASATVLAALQARAREQALQSTADKIRQEKTREIADLNRRHAALVDSLRHRPDRPADYLLAAAQAADTGPATGCGADQLFRQDAAVALGIARDADLVRIALQQCHTQYQAAADATQEVSHQ